MTKAALFAGALLPVAAGISFVLVPAISRILGPIRTFAVSAALAVAFVELVPSAARELGWPAFLVFFIALLVPHLIEIGAQGIRGRLSGHLALELGYVGLFIHQGFHGLEIGAASLTNTGAAPIVFAVAAHTVPLVAVAVLGYAQCEGQRTAIWRGLGLGLATGGGVTVGLMGAAYELHSIEPWLRAAIAGLLLHVLSHGLETNPPHTNGQRTIDLVAMFLGMAIPIGWLYATLSTLQYNLLLKLFQEFVDVSLPLMALAAMVLAGGATIHEATSGSSEPLWPRARARFDSSMALASPWMLVVATTLMVLASAEYGGIPHWGLATPWGVTMGVVLAIVFLRSIWQRGFRIWLVSLTGTTHHHHH
ncbi:MAG: hypothetical protein HN348_02070 [Proteobacteria bacterium]|nr:hypothetical protein [Pseudomonadota bacterium]